MPLSAKSPDGPICLVGLDAVTLENLKERNRKEKLYTSKCCDAPVQIRIAEKKIPHFYHIAKSPNCSGGRETLEHLSLKAEIALACRKAGWDVEVEAELRDEAGKLVWKADILAKRGRVSLAFEVELSKPDWNYMLQRQRRYAKSNVRGLWFVKTKKPFPAFEELPIFNIYNDDGWQVNLDHPNDWPSSWSNTWGHAPIDKFIAGALSKKLKWAPYRDSPDITCGVKMYFLYSGKCQKCRRDVGRPYSILMTMSSPPDAPEFQWHQGMSGRPSAWALLLTERIGQKLHAATNGTTALLNSRSNSCGYCGESAQWLGHGKGPRTQTMEVQLSTLPPVRLGSIEWDWLHRWVFSHQFDTADG